MKRRKICPSCGAENPEHEPLCTVCAVDISGVSVTAAPDAPAEKKAPAAAAPVKTCPNCRGANNDYAILCDNCGADLSAVESAAPPDVQTPGKTPSGPGGGSEAPVAAETTTIDRPSPKKLLLRSEDGKIELSCFDGTVIGRCDRCQNQMERERAECNRAGRLTVVHCRYNTVSRRHAKIVIEKGTFFIVALPESKNATIVNGSELSRGQKCAVNTGDEIYFSSKLRLYAELV